MARKRKRRPLAPPTRDARILNAGTRFELTGNVAFAPVEAAGEDDGPKIPRFSGTAYTGGQMRVWAYYYPIVVELSGLKTRSDSVPTLLGHDASQIVGHTDEVTITAQTLKIAGAVSGAGDAAREVIESSGNGFPWKLSVGVDPTNVEFVKQGETAKANGRTFTGPCNIVRGGNLEEVSFVPIAADAKTYVKVAASNTQRSDDMDFEQWVMAEFSLDAAELTEEQRKRLQAKYQAAIDEQNDDDSSGPVTASAPDAATAEDDDPVKSYRGRIAAEQKRIAMIEAEFKGEFPALQASAIEDGWDQKRVKAELKRERELAELRAGRPRGPSIHADGGHSSAAMIEAGLLMSLQFSDQVLVQAYGEQVVEKGARFRNLGIKELVDICCSLDGRQPVGFGASAKDRIEAGFSTTSLPGILSNIAHKVMLNSYLAVPGVAKILCKALTASDFKTHTGYRLSGDLKFEKVAQDGELTHGKLDESSYTYSVDTYGKMFGLTRQMMRNDDLGAFAEIPRLIGRGSALMEERLFWTLVLANTGDFFHADNANIITKVLGSEGLGLAAKSLEEQTDDQGDPILVMGRYLVVPPALRVTADELYQSTNINTGGSSTKEKVPNKNIYAGRYEPVCSPYASNTSFHASASATAWYLWGDPADVAAFGFASLDGQSAPIIEEVPLSGEYLGKAWRGYRDIGFCQIDPRGAAKSTGATS